MFLQKYKFQIIKVLLSLLPIVIIIPIALFFSSRTLIVFPNSEFGNQVDALADFSGDLTKRKSEIIDYSLSEDKMIFKFILREGSNYPDAFLIFWFDKNQPGIDISGFDNLIIKVDEVTPKKAVLFIKTFAEGISSTTHEAAHKLRHNEQTVYFSPEIHTYKIPIQGFVTPSWWYNGMNTSGLILGKETFKKVFSFDIHFMRRDTLTPLDKPETIIIKQITFQKSVPAWMISILFALIIYYLLLAFIVIYPVFKPTKLIEIASTSPEEDVKVITETPPAIQLTYKPLEVENYRTTEFDRLIDFINCHYSNPDISTSMIHKETGIPASHAFSLIKEKYQCTFKQLIIKIRLTEAKRLLKTTDHRIVDIAYMVGFNDISYFNKLFRQEENRSPKEYRENKSAVL